MTRKMALTQELVDLCFRQEIDEGRHPGLTPVADDEYPAFAEELAARLGAEPLWVFGYGSLIWKPGFEYASRRCATAFGWHRSFCLEMQNWRGSHAQPGLMLALDRGGRCNGFAFEANYADRTKALDQLVDREIGYREDMLWARWINVATDEGPLRALTFYAAPRGVDSAPRLPLERVAWVLARACGHVGSGADYLFQTVLHLEEHGIHDRNLWTLQALVAAEIATMHKLSPLI